MDTFKTHTAKTPVTGPACVAGAECDCTPGANASLLSWPTILAITVAGLGVCLLLVTYIGA